MNALTQAGALTSSALTSVSPDAGLIALCEKHKANLQAYLDSPEVEMGHTSPAWDTYSASLDEVQDTVPQTMAGILALIRVAQGEARNISGEEGEWDHGPAAEIATAICHTLLRLFGTLPDPDAAAPPPDSALIAACEEAIAADQDWTRRLDAVAHDDVLMAQMEHDIAPQEDRKRDLIAYAASRTPTTRGAEIALARLAVQLTSGDFPTGNSYDRVAWALVRSIAASAGYTPPTAQPPEVALICAANDYVRLEGEYCRLAVVQGSMQPGPESEAIGERLDTISDRQAELYNSTLTSTPATTMEGLRAKARALRAQIGKTCDLRSNADPEDNLAWSLIHDILGEEPWPELAIMAEVQG